VRGLFVAAAAEDDAAWAKLLSPDFYAYDGGKRFGQWRVVFLHSTRSPPQS
jgi:hypothetical protein